MNCRFAFAIHVLSALALQPEGALNSEQLGATVNTNPVVIRRLLLELRAANLVTTQRGPGGGARLARSAAEISLADIHRAVSGNFHVFGEHPNEPAQNCPIGRGIKTLLEEVAARAAAAVEREYEAISLAEVAGRLGAS